VLGCAEGEHDNINEAKPDTTCVPLALDEPKEVMERHIRNAGMNSKLPDFNALTQPEISKVHAEIHLCGRDSRLTLA